ncbi:hypothetical protein DSECCO2_109220 [anaerobic digester metagenome]
MLRPLFLAVYRALPATLMSFWQAVWPDRALAASSGATSMLMVTCPRALWQWGIRCALMASRTRSATIVELFCLFGA